MLPYCHLDSREHISVKFHLEFKSFHSRKCTWKCRLRNGGHFVSASVCLVVLRRHWCYYCNSESEHLSPKLRARNQSFGYFSNIFVLYLIIFQFWNTILHFDAGQYIRSTINHRSTFLPESKQSLLSDTFTRHVYFGGNSLLWWCC